MSAKRTMTLNLSDDEMLALDALAQKKELSKTGVIRQASSSSTSWSIVAGRR